MYQGPIAATDSAPADESSILRELRWTDLVARIAASRGQRGPVMVGSLGIDPSFASFSRESTAEGQRDVNRDALSHGKVPANRTFGTADTADNGDRENK